MELNPNAYSVYLKQSLESVDQVLFIGVILLNAIMEDGYFDNYEDRFERIAVRANNLIEATEKIHKIGGIKYDHLKMNWTVIKVEQTGAEFCELGFWEALDKERFR